MMDDKNVARTEYAVEVFKGEQFDLQVDVFSDYSEAEEYVCNNPIDDDYRILRIDYDDDENELGTEYIFEYPGNNKIKESILQEEISRFVDAYNAERISFMTNSQGMTEEQALAAIKPDRDKQIEVLLNGPKPYFDIYEHDYIDHKTIAQRYNQSDHAEYAAAEEIAKREFGLFKSRLSEIRWMFEPEYNNYMIYQLRETFDYRFVSYDNLKIFGFSVDKANYEPVYSGKIPVAVSPSMLRLNMLYNRFNMDRPADYVGYSMSVSDIIVLRKDGQDKAYYVDSFGFKEVPEFVEQINKEKEKKAEEIRGECISEQKAYLNKLRLYVDMDGTLAEFKTVDTLEILYEEGYFLNLKPNETVIGAVRNVIKNNPEIEVFICSSYLSDSKYALKEKNEWLDRYLPEIPEEKRLYLPCGQAKADFIKSKMGRLNEKDFLLDDYTINLNDWEPPAKGIKLLNGINHTRGTWKNNRISYERSCEEIAKGIIDMMKYGKVIMDEPVKRTVKQI